ncbi:MAG: helix-turn-helix domain-containing protein [Candidatus Competibacterales bacterium]|nr:helix-turn-helix domain-containing protein [Candidatus Competibacterales bacterium]
MTTDNLGQRIEQARAAKGLSRAELSDHLGVKNTTLKSWERNQSQPRANRLITLAGLLGVSPLWLLEGETEGSTSGAPLRSDPLSQLQRKLARAIQQQQAISATLQEIEADLQQMEA